ncbi:MAG: glycosyltransferase [Synergistaceae bacterium]|nr:glycosyltransferase [Synergistaceae bacterium]
MNKIAILIPCFNEALSVGKVISDWKHELPEAEIYVYDNNSTDGTAQAARDAGALVRNEYRQGKGNVIRSMFSDIDAECYIMVDGDDTYSAAHGREMSELVLSGMADMVIGDRLSSTYFHENKRPFHNAGNSAVRALINLIFGSNVRDVMTGCRAMSYRFVKSFPLVSQGFEIETEMTIHAIDKNMLLKNQVIGYSDRHDGSSSKLNTFSDGLKVIRTILHLFCDYRPMLFFSVISAFLALLSALFFLPVMNEYLATGLVMRFPTLIVCGFGAVAAMISFFSGVILQTIKNNERRDFEFRLKEVNEWHKHGSSQ